MSGVVRSEVEAALDRSEFVTGMWLVEGHVVDAARDHLACMSTPTELTDEELEAREYPCPRGTEPMSEGPTMTDLSRLDAAELKAALDHLEWVVSTDGYVWPKRSKEALVVLNAARSVLAGSPICGHWIEDAEFGEIVGLCGLPIDGHDAMWDHKPVPARLILLKGDPT